MMRMLMIVAALAASTLLGGWGFDRQGPYCLYDHNYTNCGYPSLAACNATRVDAGVSAYIVGNLQKDRIKTILDLCISRFNAFSRLQDELDRTKSALEERKVIDRAKGILMKAKNMSEEDAYALLRKTA